MAISIFASNPSHVTGSGYLGEYLYLVRFSRLFYREFSGLGLDAIGFGLLAPVTSPK
jgi:hypothetical protein